MLGAGYIMAHALYLLLSINESLLLCSELGLQGREPAVHFTLSKAALYQVITIVGKINVST